MSWNYRIVRKINGGQYEEYSSFGIYETYYWPDQSVKFCAARPSDPYGETFEELKECMHQMAEAFHRPSIEWNEAWNDD
jgi:hypothetical protein